MKRVFQNRLYKSIFIIVLGVMFFFCLSSTTVYADTSDKNEYSLINEDVNKIIDKFNDILPEGIEKPGDLTDVSDLIGFEFLVRNLIQVIKGESGEFFEFFLMLFGIALLTALSSQLEGELGGACKNAVSIVAGVIIFERVYVFIESVSGSLSEINSFFTAVIPLTAAVNLLGMSPTAASIQGVGMNMTLQVYSFISGEFLSSFVGVLLSLSVVSAFDSGLFGGIAKTLKNAFLVILGALTSLISATVSLQNVIASYADSGVIRTAKYAVSNMIPIVGNTVSSAFSVLAGSVSYVKGIVGGGAIASIVFIAISPLVSLLMYKLCFSIAIFLSNLCSQEQGNGVLSSFSFALDSLIAVYTLTVVVYIIQIAIFLKGGASFV